MTRVLKIEAENQDEVPEKVRKSLEKTSEIKSVARIENIIEEINLIKKKKGFLGFGKKSNIYEVILKDKLKENKQQIEKVEDDIKEDLDIDGDFQFRVTKAGVMVRIIPPQGEGKPVRYQQIKQELDRKEIVEVDWGILQEAVEKAETDWLKIAPRKPELDKDGEIQVNISEDKIKAFLDYYPALGGHEFSVQELLNKLEEIGVSYGIKEDKLARLVENREKRKRVLIAEGIASVPGQDAHLIYHFEEQKEAIGTKRDDGSIDFYDLGLINNVEAGDVLVTIKKAEPGQPGTTVTGEQILPPDPKTVKLPQGKNVNEKHGTSLVAEIDGQVMKSNNKVNVLPVHKVNGDVDLSTGNINFVGSVVVQRDVLEGFSIKAEGNVEIRGNVTGAIIESAGEVVIHKGFIGKERGNIKAGGDVRIKFVENGNITTDQSIYVSDAVMHSNLQAGDTIEVTRKKGLIVGGNCQAGIKVAANVVGSNLATTTRLETGIDPESKKSMQELKEKIFQNEENLTKTNRALDLLKKLKNNKELTAEKVKMLNKLKNTRIKLQNSLQKSQNEYEILKEKTKELSHSRIVINEKVFPGTSLIINGFQYNIQDRKGQATFMLEEGEIRQVSL